LPRPHSRAGDSVIDHRWTVRFAALFHDLGKVAYRAHRTGAHPSLGAHLVRRLDWLPDRERVAELVDRHHTASGDGLLRFLREADAFSASERQEADDEAYGDVADQPMPNRWTPHSPSPADERYWSIRPLPTQWGDLGLPQPLRTCGRGSAAYEGIERGLEAGLLRIRAGDPALAFESCLSVLEAALSFVPSAAYGSEPDISLYDHLRLTSAIADCLLQGRGEPAMHLLEFEFPGIQRFLFHVRERKAGLGLTGRSLFVSLLVRRFSGYLLHRLGLTRAHEVLASAGHALLLIPASVAEQAEGLFRQAAAKVAEAYGEAFAPSYGIAPWHPGQGPSLLETWGHARSEVDGALHRHRLRPFATWEEAGLRELFAVRPPPRTKACEHCGLHEAALHPSEDDSSPPAGEDLCEACRDFVELGRGCQRAKYLWWPWPSDAFEPQGLRDFRFLGLPELEGLREEGPGLLLRIDGPALPEDEVLQQMGGMASAHGFAWVPAAGGGTRDMLSLAQASRGVKRWGVLKVDLDRLGTLFHEIRRGGPSREAHASRRLAAFFEAYLPSLVGREYRDKAYVLYAGGDDMTIVGAWSWLPEIASRVRAGWRDLITPSQEPTMSAAIAVAPEVKAPLLHVVEEADGLLDEAKAAGRDRVAFMGGIFRWDNEWQELWEMHDLLYPHFAAGAYPRALLHTLSTLHALWDEARRAAPSDRHARRDDRYGRWRSVGEYQLARLQGRVSGPASEALGTLRAQFREWVPLGIAGPCSRWLELETRRQEVERS